MQSLWELSQCALQCPS
uniref:Uncharacterized protein n=1 Tax=Anguilla anguilla TaxID=7936 RepID=A0A0E9P7N4_ANGAN